MDSDFNIFIWIFVFNNKWQGVSMISEKIKEALFWILILTSVVFFLWRLFGNSPTTDMILFPLIVALLVDHAVLKTKFENFEKQFSALAKDFKVHLLEFRATKENLSTLSNNINTLTKDFKERSKVH